MLGGLPGLLRTRTAAVTVPFEATVYPEPGSTRRKTTPPSSPAGLLWTVAPPWSSFTFAPGVAPVTWTCSALPRASGAELPARASEREEEQQTTAAARAGDDRSPRPRSRQRDDPRAYLRTRIEPRISGWMRQK